MKNALITADLIFFEIAKESFNFPIRNYIRTSFWLLNAQSSTFSEIQYNNEPIEVWKTYRLKIRVGTPDFMYEQLKKGIDFKLGIYPFEIAYGRIIDFEPLEIVPVAKDVKVIYSKT